MTNKICHKKGRKRVKEEEKKEEERIESLDLSKVKLPSLTLKVDEIGKI